TTAAGAADAQLGGAAEEIALANLVERLVLEWRRRGEHPFALDLFAFLHPKCLARNRTAAGSTIRSDGVRAASRRIAGEGLSPDRRRADDPRRERVDRRRPLARRARARGAQAIQGKPRADAALSRGARRRVRGTESLVSGRRPCARAVSRRVGDGER